MDFIRVNELEIECIVGMRPRERHQKQPVRLSLALGLNLAKAGRTGRILDTIDYSRVADDVGSLLRFRQYRLIEMATEEISAMLFGCYPVLEQIRIRLEKPEALKGRALGTSVEIERSRADFPSAGINENNPSVRTLLETDEAGLYLLRLNSGQTLKFEDPRWERRVQWLLAGEVRCGGGPLVLGEPCESTQALAFENVDASVATVFCCACQAGAQSAATP
ncbi:MAG: dihydroneopterin aldolase [Polyangiaceae bacterium]|nr:dihydroneopterin aldolase [Polyangiaceae bacterium]